MSGFMPSQEFQDFIQVRHKMEGLGFTHASQDLYARWRFYSDREKQTIMKKWNVK